MTEQNINQHEGKKYLRKIHPADKVGEPINVDVYSVLEAFNVTCPAIAHAIKKLLAPGQRGKGDAIADLKGVLAAVNRAIDLIPTRVEWEPVMSERVTTPKGDISAEIGRFIQKEPERKFDVSDLPLPIDFKVGEAIIKSGATPYTGKELGRTEFSYGREEWPPGYGHWEVCPVDDETTSRPIGYRVRWSIPDDKGRFSYESHYISGEDGDPSLAWCFNAAESTAKRWNEEKRMPQQGIPLQI